MEFKHGAIQSRMLYTHGITVGIISAVVLLSITDKSSGTVFAFFLLSVVEIFENFESMSEKEANYSFISGKAVLH